MLAGCSATHPDAVRKRVLRLGCSSGSGGCLFFSGLFPYVIEEGIIPANAPQRHGKPSNPPVERAIAKWRLAGVQALCREGRGEASTYCGLACTHSFICRAAAAHSSSESPSPLALHRCRGQFKRQCHSPTAPSWFCAGGAAQRPPPLGCDTARRGHMRCSGTNKEDGPRRRRPTLCIPRRTAQRSCTCPAEAPRRR